jgi:anaerobic magnesium-protoporphyrin IX monomethyl ester cyclase
MRILLINVPHPAIGSRIPDDHLPPLGLLSIGGPLLDAGHQVRLVDGELGPLSKEDICAEAVAFDPQAVLFGHSGSTSAHPVIAGMSRAIRERLPEARIVYGGVFPTYHWREILSEEPQIDCIVRGEGEAAILELAKALERGTSPTGIRGLVYRSGMEIRANPDSTPTRDLDRFRVGWELIDFKHYSYWGGKRAVVVQFSRGCPHRCVYCGQRRFWARWRHRDPVRFARELAWLHREHGVEVVNFADENPTVSRDVWRSFLDALVAENVNLTLVGSTRADDIVRDADLLHLYKKAGWTRFLLGLENTDESTLKFIQKGSTIAKDREAIRLLRQAGILSMATWAVGFAEERDRNYWRTLRQILSYDPDQIQSLHATPHRWTPYFRIAAGRNVIQPDLRLWDYKHQVLGSRYVAPWRVFAWVKLIEAAVQARPKALWRTFLQPDRHLRHGMRWYSKIGLRVWFHEVRSFFFHERRRKPGITLDRYWPVQGRIAKG